MSTSGRLTPSTAKLSPIATTFGKPVHAKSNRANDQEVVAIKFSRMHPTDVDRAGHTRHPHKSNGQLAVKITSSRDNHTPLTSLKPKTPWWKSSIIKLIGSFVVGIVCLSIVAAAVVIRSDSSRSQSSSTLTSVTVNPVSKRSTSNGHKPSGVKDNQPMFNSDENVGLMSVDSLKVPVPINVVIDPQLIVSQDSSMSVQPEVLSSSNLDLTQSLVEESDTRQMKAAIAAEKSFGDSSNRYVIEMDIKVKKSK